MNKMLKWENATWFLRGKRSSRRAALEQGFDNDYIIHGKPKLFMTPNGPMPVGEENLWIGHTNFELDQEAFYRVANTIAGVEGARIISRYRFEVCFGKLFNEEELLRMFKEELLKVNGRYWAIVKDKQSIIAIYGESAEEVLTKAQDKQVIRKSWVNSPITP